MYYWDHFLAEFSFIFDLIYTEKGLVYLGINHFDPPDFVPDKEDLIPFKHHRFRQELLRYLKGERTDFDYDLDLRTTPFRNQVYAALLTIPYGEVCTYKEIAFKINNPQGQRAVGQAVGDNPLPIVVPCHRVVAKNSLGGFSLGLDLKRKLLKIENSNYYYRLAK